jgi:FlaG/FlaF family flagellin (archaellin)
MKKEVLRKKNENAVSPVVGVMLMLVVTIIIAAVVSGFAGGLIGGAKKSPSLTMDLSIKNEGTFANSQFMAKVISVSEGIQTKDLKIVTTWTNSAGIKGGTNLSAAANVFGWNTGGFPTTGTAPWGYGPGVAASNSGKPDNLEQQFGNYTLMAGTIMYAYPAGQSGGYIGATADTKGYGVLNKFVYDGWTYNSGTQEDGMQAVLGSGWETLKTGNVVNFRIIYLPSGETIFKKDVVVS